jgi:hypothetical protein
MAGKIRVARPVEVKEIRTRVQLGTRSGKKTDASMNREREEDQREEAGSVMKAYFLNQGVGDELANLINKFS